MSETPEPLIRIAYISQIVSFITDDITEAVRLSHISQSFRETIHFHAGSLWSNALYRIKRSIMYGDEDRPHPHLSRRGQKRKEEVQDKKEDELEKERRAEIIREQCTMNFSKFLGKILAKDAPIEIIPALFPFRPPTLTSSISDEKTRRAQAPPSCSSLLLHDCRRFQEDQARRRQEEEEHAAASGDGDDDAAAVLSCPDANLQLERVLVSVVLRFACSRGGGGGVSSQYRDIVRYLLTGTSTSTSSAGSTTTTITTRTRKRRSSATTQSAESRTVSKIVEQTMWWGHGCTADGVWGLDHPNNPRGAYTRLRMFPFVTQPLAENLTASTLLQSAISSTLFETVEDKIAMVQLLLDFGADIRRGPLLKEAIVLAASRRNATMHVNDGMFMRALRRCSGEEEAKMKTKQQHDDSKLVTFLIEAGADVNGNFVHVATTVAASGKNSHHPVSAQSAAVTDVVDAAHAPLLLATRAHLPELVELLVSYRACDVNQHCPILAAFDTLFKTTAYHLDGEREDALKIIDLLLKTKRCDVTATAAHISVTAGGGGPYGGGGSHRYCALSCAISFGDVGLLKQVIASHCPVSCTAAFPATNSTSTVGDLYYNKKDGDTSPPPPPPCLLLSQNFRIAGGSPPPGEALPPHSRRRNTYRNGRLLNCTPLGAAVVSGQHEIVKYLLTQIPYCCDGDQQDHNTINCPDAVDAATTTATTSQSGATTALICAVRMNSLDMCKLLLETGKADPNAPSTDGLTPLLISCERGDDVTAKLLLDFGADVDAGRTPGSALSPIAAAVYSQKFDVVNLLMGKLRELDERNQDGTSSEMMKKTLSWKSGTYDSLEHLCQQRGGNPRILALLQGEPVPSEEQPEVDGGASSSCVMM